MSVTAAAGAEASEQEGVELALIAKALGHPARVRILQLLLAQDSCYCGQLVEELPLAQATVSQHLKVLKEAGLIVGEIEGMRTCYCASRERLGELYQLVGGLLAEVAEVDTRGCD
jgi:ArsR family transcriptional regulator